AMLSVAKKHGASSHIHLRSKGVEALREALTGAKNIGTSLHVVHVNSTGADETAAMLVIIEEEQKNGVDVTTEAYPYEAGMTGIESAFFDDWESWEDEKFGIHQWVETGEFLTRETFGKYRETGGMIAIHERTEEMTHAAITSPLAMIASDGIMENGKGHPRTTGTYAKVLGKYVREKGALSLMEALRKMTIAPAQRLETYNPQMAAKGRIEEGADADIAIFDPETVIDQSTYTQPTQTSKGIPYVIVNGKIVVEENQLVVEQKPGIAIRRK
ncbi:MAG: amidohydrolase family protein, partial [Cyclobacteriaceae bacterium]|nr:amidohydrolase family protein [Cyclobacteriaceae bacterium]